MAISELEIKITWENDSFFKMTQKHDSGDAHTVIEVNENSHIESVWGDVASICRKYLNSELNIIGGEMKE